MYETLDIAINAASIGILGLLCVHLVLSRSLNRKTVSALAMLLVIGAMMVMSLMAIENSGIMQSSYWWIRTAIVALCPVLIAWGLLELFIDEFELQPWQLAFVAASITSHFVAEGYPAFDIFCHLSSLLIYVYLLFVTITTNRNDLVEDRLKFRQWFMTLAAIDGVLLTAAHWWLGDINLPVWFHMFKAVTMLILILVFAYWALVVRDNLWADPVRNRKGSEDSLSPAEMAVLQKLKSSMENDIWRQEGLTIRKLADDLETPEHRLRKVINKGLGYRNFAAFVNEHRIKAACEVLADPVKADIPIISIAYDVGYASLGPFNRAFREIIGENPTQFRKRTFSKG
jgi:AraC-like DNA-binding protein